MRLLSPIEKTASLAGSSLLLEGGTSLRILIPLHDRYSRIVMAAIQSRLMQLTLPC